MARKKSVQRSAQDFKDQIKAINSFITSARRNMTDQHISWAYEYSIMRLYRSFESMMLDALVGAINHNTSTISERTGITFPAHLTYEVCEYIIIGDGYFDFRGRDGLIKTLKDYVPANHYLVRLVKKEKYKKALEQLSVLRNLAAHNSKMAKSRARETLGQARMPEAGVWLKKQHRFENIVRLLRELAQDIKTHAPY